MILASQFLVSDRKKTVMTSGTHAALKSAQAETPHQEHSAVRSNVTMADLDPDTVSTADARFPLGQHGGKRNVSPILPKLQRLKLV